MDTKALKNKILELAIKGKLVPQNPNDEPVQVLLEKIRAEKEKLIKEGKIKKEKPLPPITEDEIPFDLPKGWEWVRLGEIGRVFSGGTPNTNKKEYWENGKIPWLTPADLSSYKSKYVSNGKRFITELGLKNSSAQLIPRGAVLFSSRAPIGYVAIAKNELCTNQGFKSCVPFIKEINEYIYYYLKYASKIINENASGTTFKEISGTEFANLIIPLPPLNEQKRIVEKVDELFALIDELDYEKENLKELIKLTREKALQLAIQGKLVPQDLNDEPAQVLLEKIRAEKEKLIKEGKIKKEKPLPPITEDEVPFELSKGWEWVRLGEIVFIGENKNIHKELDLNIIVNYVDIDCIDNKKYKIKEIKRKYVKELSSRARRVLRKDFILYSLVRPYLNNIAIINEDKDNFIGSTGFVVFKPIIVDIKYIFYFLISPYIRNYYLDLMKGFNSPSINMEEFITTFIPLPPLNEQKRIVEKLDQLMTLCDELEAEIEKSKKDAEKLMQAVLQEAFKGTNNIYPLT